MYIGSNFSYSGVNFSVISVKDAEKKDYVAVEVKYDNYDKIYTYIRKAYQDKKTGANKTLIDGISISFVKNNDDYTVTDITRVYNTTGKKRSTTESLNKPKNTTGKKKSIVEAIKEDAEMQEIEIPKVEYEPKEAVHHKEFETIKTCISENIPVYLAGPAGSGKNHTLEQIADELNLDFYFTNSVQQEYKLTGFIDAGGTYHETEFYKAFKNGGIFFLDEMDASIPEVLVLLNAAIANGYFEFPNGKITAHENFRVVAAGNTVGNGADENYTGRMVLDQATLDRFCIIEFDYDRNIEMHLAKGNTELVDFIEEIRKSANTNMIRATFSYRCISMVAKLENKMDLTKIIVIAIVKGLDNDSIKVIANNTYINGDNKYLNALKEIAA